MAQAVQLELQRVVDRWRQLPLDHALRALPAVRELVDRLAARFEVSETEVETTREAITFKLPRGLEAAA